MTGELDDPLLLNGIGGKEYGGAGHNGGFGMNPEDSSMGINNMGGDESSMSIKNMGHGGGHGFEDSELKNAKKCALISINEIVYLLITMNRHTMFPDKIKYYEKVVKEILAL